MDYRDFVHPEDEAALKTLKSVPGMDAVVKKINEIGVERRMRGLNLANHIRLSERQLPELYKHLPPICERFGIDIPEFYLEMTPEPNAYTMGDSIISVTITTGLLDMCDDELLDAVLAHECGHILCHHVLYNSVAQAILNGIPIVSQLTSTTIGLALYYWARRSEYSADRAAAVYTSPETAIRMNALLAGGVPGRFGEINIEEWMKQGEEYEKIKEDHVWDKALHVYNVALWNHPFNAARAIQIARWAKTDQYRRLCGEAVLLKEGHTCPNCGKHIPENWTFCRFCGHKFV